MKLIFLTICLIIVLITEETLIVSGFHTRRHRLLPLVIALMALYDFYMIVEDITGQHETIDLLAKLLLIQFLDVVIYYFIDYMKIKIGNVIHLLIITLLIIMDVVIFLMAQKGKEYMIFVAAFSIVSILGIAILVITQSPDKWHTSRRDRRNNITINLALFIPAFALILVELGVFEASIGIPLASDICCIVIEYLFLTDRLQDVDSLLREEHFHTLKIPAFLFDDDFFFLDASKKAREVFFREIVTISLSPKHFALQEQIKQILDGGGVAYRQIYDRFYRLELQEAKYKGKKRGYILTFVDITDEKKETDMAKELAQQKSEFLANMSHDLRSPLHAIIGSSEVALTRADMSSKSLLMVNHIHEAGKNLLDIVNSILDFSKLESGELKLYPQKYNFLHLVEEQARQSFVNLRDSEVSLSVEIRDAFPEYLYGDKIRVRQIVQNLMTNAIKFTEKGAITCFFDVSIEEQKRVRITYTVKDTGIGMSKVQQEQIFGDYVTFAQEQNKEGTGLGLPIVKKLSDMMGGNVKVESKENVGTTFTVTFYQELDKDDIVRLKNRELDLLSPTVIRGENDIQDDIVWKNTVTPSYVYPAARVLLADDMDVNCEIFKSFTEPWGFKLDIAKNGAEAAEMAAETTYDLIFLDQMMPVLSGLETADKIHKAGIDVPMILLSANITESMKAESKTHGLATFMNKPIDIVQLKTNIEAFLPKGLQVEATAKSSYSTYTDQMQTDGYIKALRTYVEEVQELCQVLPGYAENDLDMFRNKVHGIKGVSRQLGMSSMGDYSEVMEMAAISNHQEFIRHFLAAYMDELVFTIETGRSTIEQYEKAKRSAMADSDSQADLQKLSSEKLRELLDKMAKALADYDMSSTDEAIRELDSALLPEEVEAAYTKAKEAYEDMEYEEALAIIKKAVRLI